ncbi:MAG: M1 family metallopeptidase [Chloroflexota bacterium]
MKHLLASLLTIGLLAACTFVLPIPSTPSPTAPDIDLDRIEPDIPAFREGLVASAQPVLKEMEGAPTYQIEFAIDESLTRVDGKEYVRYTNREDVPLEEIRFRLFPNILGGKMTVTDLRVESLPVTPRYELNDSLMIVPLAQALVVGAHVNISMEFAVEVPTAAELNYGVLAYTEEVLTLAHAYPMICVYDDEGWNAELPPQSGDVTYADASFFLVAVTAPEGVTVVASGAESGPVKRGPQEVWTVAAGPARDFFVAASRAFEVESRTVGEVTVNSYAVRGLEGGMQSALETAVRAVETYSAAYAPYPYTELDVVGTPTLALGVEYPGVIAIANRIYAEQYSTAPDSFVRESTVAHEVGHQWFYNLVGNDQLDEPWLDESLTQFVTWEYFRLNYDASAASGFEDSLRRRWGRVEDAPIPIGRPVAAYAGVEYSAVVYGRGALFFDALRDEMGESAFDALLKDYAAAFAWKIATAEGLKSLAEEHCACDLTELFGEWVY